MLLVVGIRSFSRARQFVGFLSYFPTGASSGFIAPNMRSPLSLFIHLDYSGPQCAHKMDSMQKLFERMYWKIIICHPVCHIFVAGKSAKNRLRHTHSHTQLSGRWFVGGGGGIVNPLQRRISLCACPHTHTYPGSALQQRE